MFWRGREVRGFVPADPVRTPSSAMKGRNMSVLRDEAARRVLARVHFNHRHAGTNSTQITRLVNGRPGRACVSLPVPPSEHVTVDPRLPRPRLHPRVQASDA